MTHQNQRLNPEYSISDKNEIVWREDLQKMNECFRTQTVKDFIVLLNDAGFGKPVLMDNGCYCRVLKGDVSPTQFDTEMDAYVDCYSYAIERNLI